MRPARRPERATDVTPRGLAGQDNAIGILRRRSIRSVWECPLMDPFLALSR